MSRAARDASHGSTYVPALRFDWLTPIYDPFIKHTLRERKVKRALIQQADVRPQSAVLDLGCGTATLTIMLKKAHPQAEVTGLDGDPKALAIAHAKATREGVAVKLDRGMAYQLPYPDNAFDRVLSSLMFHHLSSEHKRQACKEIHRVLRPGGSFHVADWGRPQNPLMSAAFLGVRLLDGFENTADNAKGKLPDFFRGAGFAGVEETRRFMTAFGTLSLFRALKPPA